MLKIVQAPDDALAKKAKSIEKIDKVILRLISEMTETLMRQKDPEGVGLAAPQVGKSLRLFLVRLTPKSPVLSFINPVMSVPLGTPLTNDKTAKKEKSMQLEGCLSLNNIWGVVKRYESIMLSFTDEKGKYHKKKFSGFLSTVIQHEYDHLQGILFPKRVLEQNGKLYKAVLNEKRETIFEEIEI